MGFFNSGFGRILAGVGTMGLSEAFLNPSLKPITAAVLPAGGTALGTALGGPIGGSIGGALGGAVGKVMTSSSAKSLTDQNQWGAEQQNIANAQQAQKQMDFQERMSSTAHQREVADLKAAGLNPILSVAHGGSSTPSGASAVMSDTMAGKVSTALRLNEQNNQLTEILSKVALNISQSDLNKSNSELAKKSAISEAYKPELLQAQSASALSQNKLNTDMGLYYQQKEQETAAMTELLKSQKLTEDQKKRLTSGNADIAFEQLKSLKKEGQISDSQYGYALGYIKRLIDTIGPVLPWFAPKYGPRVPSP
ncbi:MAG: DNA pilot protein [Microviridae sp.]|nr:MAG: DNA pilot protein [Microviridae sp.]